MYRVQQSTRIQGGRWNQAFGDKVANRCCFLIGIPLSLFQLGSFIHTVDVPFCSFLNHEEIIIRCVKQSQVSWLSKAIPFEIPLRGHASLWEKTKKKQNFSAMVQQQQQCILICHGAVQWRLRLTALLYGGTTDPFLCEISLLPMTGGGDGGGFMLKHRPSLQISGSTPLCSVSSRETSVQLLSFLKQLGARLARAWGSIPATSGDFASFWVGAGGSFRAFSYWSLSFCPVWRLLHGQQNLKTHGVCGVGIE